MVHKKKEIKAYHVNRTTVVFATSMKEAKEIFEYEKDRKKWYAEKRKSMGIKSVEEIKRGY